MDFMVKCKLVSPGEMFIGPQGYGGQRKLLRQRYPARLGEPARFLKLLLQPLLAKKHHRNGPAHQHDECVAQGHGVWPPEILGGHALKAPDNSLPIINVTIVDMLKQKHAQDNDRHSCQAHDLSGRSDRGRYMAKSGTLNWHVFD
ncbi:MAG: hypothetical protein ACOY3X_11915 [Pseudomonadota bacterium]